MKRTNARVFNFAKLVAVVGALVLAFLTYQSVGADADQFDLVPVEYAGENAVPGSYIVIYKDGTTSHIASDLASLGIGDFSNNGFGYSAALNDNQLARVQRDPNVEAIVEDFYIDKPDLRPASGNRSGTSSSQVSWGLDRIDQRAAGFDGSYTPNGNGEGVRIYVMDGGVKANHPEFSGRVVGGTSFVGGDPLDDDCRGHGTIVASAAAGQTVGVANKASIYSLKVGDSCKNGMKFGAVLSALRWVAENNTEPAVLNLSFGKDRGNLSLFEKHFQRAYSEMLDIVSRNGVTIVAAAGNDGTPTCVTPAAFTSAIAVGATTRSDARNPISSHGSCVDIFAPGHDLPVADHAGGIQVLEGTSIASPYVAGAAAIYLANNPGASPEAIRSHLISSSTKDALDDLNGAHNRLLYVAPKIQLTKPVSEAVCYLESNALTAGEPSDDCSEQADPPVGGAASGLAGVIETTDDGKCFGPIIPGSSPDNAKQAFNTPVADGGCGMPWNDQLGHQCQWVDEPTAGWQCFGSRSNDTTQQQRSNSAAREATAVTQDEVKLVEVPVDQSASQQQSSVCRSRVVADVSLDQARQNFAQPVNQGGCGIPWDDQNLGHQCEWVSGSPQGWQCFGTTK